MPQLVNVSTASLEALLSAASAGRLYAVLDACDEPRVPVKVGELGPRASSLYQGESQEELWAIAPYFVAVDTELLGWLQEALWADPWGIFAISGGGFDELRTHFRKFLLVRAPDGEEWYFRFYDPRVIAAFLPTCDATELADFFGPIESYGWIDADTTQLLVANQLRFGDATPRVPRITMRRGGQTPAQ